MNIEWETPQNLFDELNNEFHLDLDVFAEDWNAKCPRYLDPKTDALKQKWSGTCWMNPPYGHEIESWIRKAYEESQRGNTVVCLLPARTETNWFHEFCLKGEVRFIRGRLWFSARGGKTGRPRFGSVIVIFRPNQKIHGV